LLKMFICFSPIKEDSTNSLVTRDPAEVCTVTGPQERVPVPAANWVRCSDDLPAGVDAVGIAVSAAEGAEVGHARIRGPHERVKRCRVIGVRIGIADDLPAGVDGGCIAAVVDAAEGAKVDHAPTAGPHERVRLRIAGSIGPSDDLSAVVDAAGIAVSAAEGAEVGHGVGGGRGAAWALPAAKTRAAQSAASVAFVCLEFIDHTFSMLNENGGEPRVSK